MTKELIKRLRGAIQKLRKTSMPIADVAPMLSQAADAIESLQAENDRLKADAEGRKVWNEAASEHMRALRAERDALAAKLASLQRYEPEIWQEDRIRMEPDSQGDWVKFRDIDAAKGGQQ